MSSNETMFCEACGDLINKGEKGTPTTRGGNLCEHCCPTLSQVIVEYNTAIAKGASFRAYGFPNNTAMKARLRDMVHELATRGDCNIAVPL